MSSATSDQYGGSGAFHGHSGDFFAPIGGVPGRSGGIHRWPGGRATSRIGDVSRFTVEADHELTQTLRRYQSFYKEAYGAAVTEADLLREMARRFMANDGDFQGFGQKRRRTKRKPPVASLAEPSNNGKLDLRGPAT